MVALLSTRQGLHRQAFTTGRFSQACMLVSGADVAQMHHYFINGVRQHENWARISLQQMSTNFIMLQEMLNVDEFKCNPFASRIVELFSEDGSGVISFQKFINIFSVFSPRATAETKTVWAFAVWDFDGALAQCICISQGEYLQRP